MALINTISIQRKAVAFTELATVLMATEHRNGMEKFNADVSRDMQAAFSDLADAMGFDIVANDMPARRRRPSMDALMSAIGDVRAEAEAALSEEA